MRLLPVWIVLGWKNFLDRMALHYLRVKAVYIRIVVRFAKKMGITHLFWFFHIKRYCGIISSNQKNRALVARENKRNLLAGSPAVDFTWIAQRRQALDFAATWGQDKKIIQQLNQCAAQLDEIVKPLHQEGTPVILAPMHMVSDILAGIVAGKTWPYQGTVIVSASAETYQEKDRLRGGVNLSYCSIHNNNPGIANNIITACEEAMEHRTNIVIFPDIVPDYTFQAQAGARQASKLKCTMFERPAHLHNGVVRLARMLSASVVFYHLYYENGVKIKIYPTVKSNSVKAVMPQIIEDSISNYPQDWLLWHQHSLYFINE